MQLPDLRNFDLVGKRVLLRVDFDVPLIEQTTEGRQHRVVGDQTRIEKALATINYLLSVDTKIILLSHLGRPEGKVVPELSLAPVAKKLQELLEKSNSKNQIAKIHIKNQKFGGFKIDENIILLENLRFEAGEEKNDVAFSKNLADLGAFCVNDAFAASHREHASIVGLPKILPHAAGLGLLREVEVLSGVLENPKRPVVVILGGTKEDKLEDASGLLKFADYVLLGGKLPSLITNYQLLITNPKTIIGELNENGKDITLETIEKFCEIIKKAGTVVWAGPMGKYESEMGNGPPAGEAGKWEMGTKEIGRAVVESGAFTVIGGGDTEAALTKFGMVEKIDFVSSGGGAMLGFLANGDLPGLAALRHKL